jgi:hypothetical protein
MNGTSLRLQVCADADEKKYIAKEREKERVQNSTV